MSVPGNTPPLLLVIIGAYLPGTNAGGPVRVMSNMVEWLGDSYQFRILTVNHDFKSSKPYSDIKKGKWYPTGKAQVRYLFNDELSLKKLSQVIRSVNYDMVYLDSVLATLSIKFITLYHTHQIPRKPVILAPRGNLDRSARMIKSTKKTLYLTFARYIGLYNGVTWHASSRQEADDIREVLKQNNVVIVPEIPSRDLRVSVPTTAPKAPGQLKIVFLARISRMKNLGFLLRTVRQLSGNIELDIYGTIEDQGYWNELKILIEELSENIHVHYCGIADFENVSEILTQYHLFALPTLGENFGHAILEALCAGCPVLISNKTRWRELSKYGVGWDLSLDEPETFIAALETMLSLDQEAFDEMSTAARKFGLDYLDNSGVVQQMQQLFEEVMQKTTGSSSSKKPLLSGESITHE